MENNLLLFSGGIDSRVCIEILKSDYNVVALGFDYDQPHKVELLYAMDYAKQANIKYDIIKIPSIAKKDDIVFCGRNAIMLSMAFSIAESREISHVTIGVNKDDRINFPDCRLDFIRSMSEVGSAYGVRLHAPLINYSKKEVIDLAKNYRVQLDGTWTCYSPTKDNLQCGECYSCKSRQNAES